MLPVSARLPADNTSTSPPAPAVCGSAVDSPGSGGVMKRVTYTCVPSALTETWRALRPMAALPSTAPFAASSLSSEPPASSATKAYPPVGANAMPKGCEPYGSANVCATASVAGLITLTVAACLLTTQTRPSGAMPSVRGPLPTAISASRVLFAALNTDTELLSWFTTQNRLPLPSNTMLLDIAGLLGVSGWWIT